MLVDALRAMDLWMSGYLRRPRRRVEPDTVTDVMFAICDHFEPLHGTDRQGALERIGQWQAKYPGSISRHRDADGVSPRHTFFYPVEQCDHQILSRLGDLCGETGAEIEVHLHHERDTEMGLRDKLERGKEEISQHYRLCVDPDGNTRFGFIHGNWALAHSHPNGHHCGVPDELRVLKEAGCYADFTMPSAPDRTQTRIVNQIYYASGDSGPKPHDRGTSARVNFPAVRPVGGISSAHLSQPGELLLVQGPLGLNWHRRKWQLLPRLENGEISGANPPQPNRLRLWLELGIHVQEQPNWVFVKLHTHGGIPRNMRVLLEDPMVSFYDHFLETCRDENGFRTHFVTAREMVNIIHAAEDGHTGDAGRFRDYCYVR